MKRKSNRIEHDRGSDYCVYVNNRFVAVTITFAEALACLTKIIMSRRTRRMHKAGGKSGTTHDQKALQ